MLLLLDGDILTYSLPFSVQDGHGDDADLVPNADFYLEARIDNFINECLDGSKCEDYKVFLTSKRDDKLEENHRYQYLPQYKAGRSSHKPILHEYARHYLEMQHMAVMSEPGLETDDMIAIEHMQMWSKELGPSVIGSIDKDFDQLPGWHYRWKVQKSPAQLYFVSEFQALKNLYLQALTGDKVDNIGYEVQDGKQQKCDYIKGIGTKTAEKMLQECETEKDMYRVCLSVYMQNMMKTGHHDHIEEEARDILHNNMQGLYLVRGFRGKQWKTWREPV